MFISNQVSQTRCRFKLCVLYSIYSGYKESTLNLHNLMNSIRIKPKRLKKKNFNCLLFIMSINIKMQYTILEFHQEKNDCPHSHKTIPLKWSFVSSKQNTTNFHHSNRCSNLNKSPISLSLPKQNSWADPRWLKVEKKCPNHVNCLTSSVILLTGQRLMEFHSNVAALDGTSFAIYVKRE